MQDAYDMSWAEFLLRSIGFKKKQEREEYLFREIAYQAHCMQYLFAKGKPPKKDAFWKIGNIKKETVSAPQRDAFNEAMRIYKEQKNNS